MLDDGERIYRWLMNKEDVGEEDAPSPVKNGEHRWENNNFKLNHLLNRLIGENNNVKSNS